MHSLVFNPLRLRFQLIGSLSMSPNTKCLFSSQVRPQMWLNTRIHSSFEIVCLQLCSDIFHLDILLLQHCHYISGTPFVAHSNVSSPFASLLRVFSEASWMKSCFASSMWTLRSKPLDMARALWCLKLEMLVTVSWFLNILQQI